jgi:hypothetical protein
VLLMVLGGVLGEEAGAGRRHVRVSHISQYVSFLVHDAHSNLVRAALESNDLRHLQLLYLNYFIGVDNRN